MTLKARVAVLPREGFLLDVLELEMPAPGPHQVLIKQFASGVCHSQLHTMHRPRTVPMVLGHESTGEVLKVGEAVTHIAPGDRVMVTWVPRDAKPGGRYAGVPELQLPGGDAIVCSNVFTWADHTLADEQYVVKLDEDVDRLTTSIIGCAVMTGAGAVENSANVQPGQSVAVIGVGGVGLSAIVAAKVRGASPIIAIDLDDDKLNFAKTMGATHVINAAKEDPVAAVRALTTRPDEWAFRGVPVAGADFVFDCIGRRVTMEQAVPAARDGFFGVAQGGTAVLVGVPTTEMTLNATDLLMHEKRFLGSLGGSCTPDHDFPRYVDWYRTGKLDLDHMVTERFSLDQINEATRALDAGEISGRAILEFKENL